MDVFFVISGYLITSILVAEIGAGEFSIAKFYERRFRRLLPALLVVVAISVPAAALVLLPGDLQIFFRSVVATSLFSSNVFFWRQSDYFDPGAEFKPLLHTWSLSVEEQFYLFYPLILGLAVRRLGTRLPWAVAIAGVVSFLAGVIATTHAPSAAFYLFPTRAWELLAGAFVATLSLHQESPLPRSTWDSRWTREAAGLIGILAVLAPIFAFDERVPFPGTAALVPVIGTALVLTFVRADTTIGRVLSQRALVLVGLASYSIYLVHQPLLSFLRYSLTRELNQLELTACVIAVFGLGFVSWRLVELPWRRKSAADSSGARTFAIRGLAASFGMAAVGLLGLAGNGFPGRYSAEQRILISSLERDSVRSQMSAFRRGECFLDFDQDVRELVANSCLPRDAKRRLVLVGDSHAAHLYPGVSLLADEFGYAVAQWTSASCRPIGLPRESKRCESFTRSVTTDVAPLLKEGDVVLLAANWRATFDQYSAREVSAGLGELIELVHRSGARVIVLGPTPQYARAPQAILLSAGEVGSVAKTLDALNDDSTVEELLGAASRFSVRFVDLRVSLCVGSVRCWVKDDAVFLYFDRSHLSVEGSKRAAESLRDYIAETALDVARRVRSRNAVFSW